MNEFLPAIKCASFIVPLIAALIPERAKEAAAQALATFLRRFLLDGLRRFWLRLRIGGRVVRRGSAYVVKTAVREMRRAA